VLQNGKVRNHADYQRRSRRGGYRLNDEEEGVYTVIDFTSEPSFPAELDRVYKITEGVMRSLIIAHEE